MGPWQKNDLGCFPYFQQPNSPCREKHRILFKNQLGSIWFAASPWPGRHESLQPCSRAARKWRENEEMRRKWRENEEMERDWLSTFPHSLSISSLFLHFLPLFPFPTSKCITFCCKMLNTALLSRMSQKSQHTRYEEIILGRNRCNEAPQVVPAWFLGFFLYKEVCLSWRLKRMIWDSIPCRGRSDTGLRPIIGHARVFSYKWEHPDTNFISLSMKTFR